MDSQNIGLVEQIIFQDQLRHDRLRRSMEDLAPRDDPHAEGRIIERPPGRLPSPARGCRRIAADGALPAARAERRAFSTATWRALANGPYPFNRQGRVIAGDRHGESLAALR